MESGRYISTRDFGTEYMLYGPRDEDELAAVVSVIEESIAFARGA